MNVTGSDVILLAHSTLGVLGILSALWVFVETLRLLLRKLTLEMAFDIFTTQRVSCIVQND
jgi:hypothetical protein